VRAPLRQPLRRTLASFALAAAVLACREPAPAAAGELRLVSLSPSFTEILVALDARDALVGVDRYSSDLPGLAGVPSLGGLFAPDLERTLELRPTVVVGVQSEAQSSFFAALRARGVAVYELETGGSLDAVLASYETIGRIVGREAEGRALSERARVELAAVARKVASESRPTVALVVERDPLYVVAGGSFASALIEAAGGRNAFADLERAYPQVSLELLAERAPDVLIDSTQRAQTPESEAAARAYWSRFAWVKRVELVPPGVATLPGASLARGADLLRARLHPESAGGAAP
jgi:ABC-type Fe3+-hydroxamate transport system substrate-binding protein